MTLTRCKACNAEISKKAKTCPKCGEPTKKKTSIASWIALILLLVGLYSVVAGRSPSTPMSSTAITSAPDDVAQPKLKVLSWSCGGEYGYSNVQGEVQNISSENLPNVQVVGEFKTADGDLIKTADAMIDYNPILPGQKSPFKALTTSNPAIKKCGMSFKFLMGGEIPTTEVEKTKKRH